MSQVELDFPSAEAAVAYARRQGLNFVLEREICGSGCYIGRSAGLEITVSRSVAS